MYRLLIYFIFFSLLFSCDHEKSLSERLDSFYQALMEIESENFTEKSGYLVEAFKKGNLKQVEQDIDFFCFKKAIAEEISSKNLCPKLKKLKKDEFIDFFTPKNTVLYFHKYFFQKIQKEEQKNKEKELDPLLSVVTPQDAQK